MATTFKAVVYRHHQKEDGTYNVKIRVTHNRVKRHIHTNIFVTKEDLTRGLKIKSQNIIDVLNDEIRQDREIVGKIKEQDIKEMSADNIIRYIETYKKTEREMKSANDFQLDFIAFAKQLIKEMKESGKEGTASNYQSAINSLIRFLNRDKLSINEITVQLLNDYNKWLIKQPAQKKQKKRRAGAIFIFGKYPSDS